MRRGITPVVAIVLLLMMTVAAAGGGYAWIQQVQGEAQGQADSALSTDVVVRNVQCRDATVTAALSNTGEASLSTGTVTAYLYEDGSLVDSVEKDVSDAAVLQPGGVSELHFPFTAYIDPGTAYRVEFAFSSDDYAVTHPCTGTSGSLVSYWTLDDDVGGTVTDLAGTVDGTVENDPAEITGQVDGALEFDGAADWVDVTDTAWEEFFDRGRFTIVAWVRPDSMSADYQNDAAGAFVGQRYGTNMVVGYRDTSEVFLNMDDTRADSPLSDTGLSQGTWHHIAVTADWDGQAVTFYIDGENAGDKTWGDGNINSGGSLALGRDLRYDMYLDGALDDVRIYQDVLPADRVQAIYNATR